MAILVRDTINLYLDANGALVVSGRKRDDLVELRGSSDVELLMPLEGIVYAKVTMIVAELDLRI